MNSSQFEPTIFTYVLKKENGRLWIVRFETGWKVYTPPDFIREKLHSREPLQKLCCEMSKSNYLEEFSKILEFESKF